MASLSGVRKKSPPIFPSIHSGLTEHNNPTSPRNQFLSDWFPKRSARCVPMDHHHFPPVFVSPLVNTHSSVRSLHISGAGEEVWRVRESGDLGRGEIGDLGGEGGWS